MDKKELGELDKKYINQMKRIVKNYNKKEVDILDFYPNFNLKTPYTNFNPLSEKNLKPFQLLAFFNGVIVDIKPFKNETEFNKFYGMSTTELLELHEKGYIYFNLLSPCSDFHNLENDYLDCILEKNIGISCWSNLYHGYVINNNSFKLFEEIGSFFKDKTFSFGSNSLAELGLIDPLTMAAIIYGNGLDNPLRLIPDENYKLFTEKNFTKLWTCGFNEINTFLKRFLEEGNGRLDYTFVFSNIYLNFLCNPILDSLNGTYLVNNQLKELYKDLTMRDFSQTFPKLNKTTPKFEVDESLILNADVGKILCDEISIPTLMSLEDYDDYDYNSPIKALQSLENAVENKNVNEILDLTEAYKNELYSAGKIAEDMQSSINNKLDLIDKFSMTIGLVGSLGSQISNPDIKPIFDISSSLGLMVPLVFKSKIGKLILNKTTRFNKPDHVLFLYDNYEKLDIHSFNRNHILNRTNYKINYIPFNDELTDKYKYYECLYENIPLIRVYIDIIAEKQVIKGYTIEHIDTKIKQYFKDLFDRELHIPKIELLTKQILLYGVAYLSKGWEYTSKGKNFKINLINPKFIRPNIKDNKIVGYKMLTKDHEEKLFLKSEIDCFKEISIIELYSFLLDANYPQITKKGDRPLLIYDKMENYEKQLEKNKDDPDKFVKILEDSLKLFKTLCDSSYPRNIYYEVGFLRVLGTIEMHKRNPRKALYYFEKAQDLIPEYPSEELKQIDYELTYIIINLQKFL